MYANKEATKKSTAKAKVTSKATEKEENEAEAVQYKKKVRTKKEVKHTETTTTAKVAPSQELANFLDIDGAETAKPQAQSLNLLDAGIEMPHAQVPVCNNLIVYFYIGTSVGTSAGTKNTKLPDEFDLCNNNQHPADDEFDEF